MEFIRATKLAQQAAAYYVRIHGMARQHHISLEEEFDCHDTPDTKYIVVVDDYLPVATCRLYAIDERKVMLGRIVVVPEYRRQGLGTRVVKAAEEWAKELGYSEALLESREEKGGFYEKLGYTAETDSITEGGTFRCILMKKEL